MSECVRLAPIRLRLEGSPFLKAETGGQARRLAHRCTHGATWPAAPRPGARTGPGVPQAPGGRGRGTLSPAAHFPPGHSASSRGTLRLSMGGQSGVGPSWASVSRPPPTRSDGGRHILLNFSKTAVTVSVRASAVRATLGFVFNSSDYNT